MCYVPDKSKNCEYLDQFFKLKLWYFRLELAVLYHLWFWNSWIAKTANSEDRPTIRIEIVKDGKFPQEFSFHANHSFPYFMNKISFSSISKKFQDIFCRVIFALSTSINKNNHNRSFGTKKTKTFFYSKRLTVNFVTGM